MRGKSVRGNFSNNLAWRSGAAIAVVMTVFASFAVPADAATEKVLYAFKGDVDGYGPRASLVDVKGNLYGTTSAGITSGTESCFSGSCGTVFAITPSGTEKLLHVFSGGGDGAGPEGGLVNINDILYGTTVQGGPNSCVEGYVSCGVVFSITRRGNVNILHAFSSSEGFNPAAGLIDVKGTLYGSTELGTGRCAVEGFPTGCGVVFSMSLSGTEAVVYGFKGGSKGFAPQAGLTNVKGTLYGTTQLGGSAGCIGIYSAPGCGTVFSVTQHGIGRVLHTFLGHNDGASPSAGLIDVDGTLYGTTQSGGIANCGNGCGTVFSLTPSGTEKVVHAFKGGGDGAAPYAGLINVKGVLYGTTSAGGASNFGTVFEVDPATGKEKVLYSFGGGSDGASPVAALIHINGIFYGTTYSGGAGGITCSGGCGTVFSFKP